MWETKDLQDLKSAVQWLEHPGWAIRLINFLGAPIEALIRVLPRSVSLMIRWLTERALGRFLEMGDMIPWGKGAVAGIFEGNPSRPGHGQRGVRRLLGAAGSLIELPVSTVLMLRAIAAVAQKEGEDLEAPGGRWACLEVFTLGGTRAGDVPRKPVITRCGPPWPAW